MTDKQRLDAYVLAAMAGMLNADNDNCASTYNKIHYAAKRMMDYVDTQEVKAEPKEDAEGWITNVGSKPINLSERFDFVFRDGDIVRDAKADSDWRWDRDDEDANAGDIIKWRKAQ